MFDALSALSNSIPDAYHRAFEFGDLHLGDLHLVKLNGLLLLLLHLSYFLDISKTAEKSSKDEIWKFNFLVIAEM